MDSNKKLIKVAFFCILLFSGCTKDEGLSESPQDFIKIISVNPSTNLEDGKEYDFLVEVDYKLKKFEKGGISISFNTNGVNSYHAILRGHATVEKGSGQHIFDVNVKAKDWKELGDFGVLVSLYEQVIVVDEENPRDPQHLADDIAVLSFSN